MSARIRRATPMRALVPALVLATATVVATQAAAQTPIAAPGEPLGLVLYQGGQAIVTDLRRVTLEPGPTSLRFPDLLPSLDPVSLTAETTGAVALRRIQVITETVDQRSLLRRLVGAQIRFASALPGDAGERVETARLVAVDPVLVLNFGDRVEIDPPGRVLFDALPEELGFTPEARLDLTVPAEQRQAAIALVYAASGLDWQAEYARALNGDTAALRGWAVLRNGLNRPIEARVALVAGDVARERPEPAPVVAMMRSEAVAMSDAAPSAPTLAEGRYLYRLPETVTLPPGGVLREALTHATAIPVERIHRLEGMPGPGHDEAIPGAAPLRPTLIVRFRNAEAARLGLPLPAGVLRLYQPAMPGATAILGEDRIGHVAREGLIELALGQPFDVTATRRTERFQRIDDRGGFEAETAITLSNAGESPVTVEIVERFPWGGTLLEGTPAPQEQAARFALWRVAVPAGGETVFRYGVRAQP